MYHSCFHHSAFSFLLPKMNFGSSVPHIVVEPATDCCRYVGVLDTIKQLLIVHIVECSCQIERVKYCSVSREKPTSMSTCSSTVYLHHPHCRYFLYVIIFFIIFYLFMYYIIYFILFIFFDIIIIIICIRHHHHHCCRHINN